MKTILETTRDWCAAGMVAVGLSACTAATDWLNEDPGGGTDRAPRQTARDIVSSLEAPASGRMEKPSAKPEPKPDPVEVAVKEPKPEPRPPKPETSEPAPAEVDISKLDLRGNFPTAAKAGSREGFVYSPYDGRIINVKGMASGSLVADPRYPLEERKYFKVP